MQFSLLKVTVHILTTVVLRFVNLSIEATLSELLTESLKQTTNKSIARAIPLQAWTGPLGSRGFRLPEFLENRYTKVVRLLALGTGRFYLQEISAVLIYVRRRVEPSAVVRSEGLCQ